MGKKIFTCALIAVVALAGVFAAVWFFGVPAAKKLVLNNAVKETERLFGVDAKIGNVGAASFNTVSIRDVELSDKKEKKPLLSAKEIKATVSPVQLIHRKVVITKLDCEKPTLNVVRRKDGTTNFDSILAKKQGAPGRPFTLVVNNAGFTFTDYFNKSLVRPIELFLGHAVFEIRPGKPVEVDIQSARYGKSEFNINGTIGLKEGEPVSLRISSKKCLSEDLKTLIVSMLGIKVPKIRNLDVPFSLQINVRGNRGSESVEINASASQGVIGARRLKGFKMRISANRESVEINRLDVRLEDGGWLSGWAKYRMAGDADLDMNFKCDRFPADVLTGVIENWDPGISGAVTANGRLAGSLQDRNSLKGEMKFSAGNGRVAGVLNGKPLEFDAIQGGFGVRDGRLDLKQFELRGKDMNLSLSGVAGLDGALDLNGQAEVSKEMMRARGMKKLVTELLPDGEKGCLFKMRVAGRFGAPRIELSAMDEIWLGAQDHVRDAGNKIEKFVKKIF